MTNNTEPQTVTVTAGDQNIEETTKKLEKMNTSFSIWPPTQRTRDAVIKRLIQTLTDKSVLSDRYGTIPSDEAAVIARRIEEEAFNAAPASPADDGIDILQSYSKEISKKMLDSVKSRSVASETATSVDYNGDEAPNEESSTAEP